MQFANRDGQLVGVVADFGHAAPRFDSEEKLIFPQVLPKYLDVRDFKPPFAPEDYAQFEFLPTQDGRRIWLQAKREGVLAIEVWRSWDQVPWDWLLGEAYSSLICLRDDLLTDLFQSRGVVQATLTLGNLLGPGGTAPDVGVTTRGLQLDLVPPGSEVLGERSRFPSIKHECWTPMSIEPWECAKAFVKRALTNTGVMLFEKSLEAVGKDDFLGQYFGASGVFHRPGGLSGMAKSTGQKIKSARERRGFTQTALASKVGISVAELERYESDQAKPNLVVLENIANALGVSLDAPRS